MKVKKKKATSQAKCLSCLLHVKNVLSRILDWRCWRYRGSDHRHVGSLAVKHLYPVRAVLGIKGCHDKADNHDKNPSYQDEAGDDVLPLKPAT